MNTHVDGTKLKKKIPYYQKVDIESIIDTIEPNKENGKEEWTRGAEILVYNESQMKRSPLNIMLTLMRNADNKYYNRAEKMTCKRFPFYKRVQMQSFFNLLDAMLIEVQNTTMYLLLTK